MPTIRDIQTAVAQRYGVTPLDLAQHKTGGHSRDARARMLVCWLAKRCTGYTDSRIGRHFGGRNHKTVAHAVQRIDHLMLIDRDLAATAEQIRGSLV